jgi:hypothetical protein
MDGGLYRTLCNESSGCTKCGVFLECVRNCQLPTNDSCIQLGGFVTAYSCTRLLAEPVTADTVQRQILYLDIKEQRKVKTGLPLCEMQNLSTGLLKLTAKTSPKRPHIEANLSSFSEVRTSRWRSSQ